MADVDPQITEPPATVREPGEPGTAEAASPGAAGAASR